MFTKPQSIIPIGHSYALLLCVIFIFYITYSSSNVVFSCRDAIIKHLIASVGRVSGTLRAVLMVSLHVINGASKSSCCGGRASPAEHHNDSKAESWGTFEGDNQTDPVAFY